MTRTARPVRAGLVAAALAALLAVTACSSDEPPADPTTDEPTTTEPTPEPTTTPTTPPDVGPPGVAVAYDLGDTTIVQERFPEDSPFRHLPVRLVGAIAAPDPAAGPAPVILVLHGAHPACRDADGGVIDDWPCDPDREQRNDLGLSWFVEELAAAGYVALAINTNAENTFGFGEVEMGDRTRDLVDLHLSALTEAAATGSGAFGVDLTSADLGRLGIVGHSRGGSEAVRLLTGLGLNPDAPGDRPYGPASGLLLLAPGVMSAPEPDLPVPLGVLLPACDGDMINQDGQAYFEALREGDAPRSWAVSFWLDGGTHNGFNTALGPDMFTPENRTDCATTLGADEHHDALTVFATEFFGAVFAPDAAARDPHLARLGLGSGEPAPGGIGDSVGRVAALPAGEDATTLLVPQGEADVVALVAGGTVTADGVALVGCDPRYVVEFDPACRTTSLTVAGYPARTVLSWERPGGALRLEVGQDLSGYAAFSLRAAVDPLSGANPQGVTAGLTVRLTDGSGATAELTTAEDEPALRYPGGGLEHLEWLGGDVFTAPLFLATVRLPLAGVEIDLTDVRTVELLPAGDAGSLILADLGFVR